MTAFVLTPIALSGFLGDDQFNSTVNGFLSLHRQSLPSFAWDTNMGFLRTTARFIPGADFEMYGIFHLVPNVFAYKIVQIALLLADLVLFVVLLRLLDLDAAFIALSVLLALTTMQFHGHYDGYLGFSGMEEVLLGLTLASWVCFARWLRGGPRSWLAAAIALYVVSVLTYETCYPFSLGHLVIAMRLRGHPWWRAALPFLLISAASFAMLAVARAAFPQQGPAVYALHVTAADVVRTLVNQVVASLPLTYLALHEHGPSPLGATFWAPTPAWLTIGVALTAFALAYLALAAMLVRARKLRSLIAIGLVLWIPPAALIAPIPRYQAEISPGFGYILMVIGGFGAAMILAVLIAKALAFVPPRARSGTVAAASAVLAAVVTLTFATNQRTLAAYHAERTAQLNVTAALDHGVAANLPDGAELWVDAPAQLLRRNNEMRNGGGGLSDPKFFIEQHAGRRTHVLATWDQPPPFACGSARCDVPEHIFALRDVPLDLRDGYTLVGHVRRVEFGPDGIAQPFVDGLRVHMRGDALAAIAGRSGLHLTMACEGGRDAAAVPIAATAADVQNGTTFDVASPCLVDLQRVALAQ